MVDKVGDFLSQAGAASIEVVLTRHRCSAQSGYAGLWVPARMHEAKLASIGIAVSRRVITMVCIECGD